MSSAGLVYLHFGKEVIADLLATSISEMGELQIVPEIQKVFNDIMSVESKRT